MNFKHVSSCGTGTTRIDLRLNREKNLFEMDVSDRWMSKQELNVKFNGHFVQENDNNYYVLHFDRVVRQSTEIHDDALSSLIAEMVMLQKTQAVGEDDQSLDVVRYGNCGIFNDLDNPRFDVILFCNLNAEHQLNVEQSELLSRVYEVLKVCKLYGFSPPDTNCW